MGARVSYFWAGWVGGWVGEWKGTCFLFQGWVGVGGWVGRWKGTCFLFQGWVGGWVSGRARVSYFRVGWLGGWLVGWVGGWKHVFYSTYLDTDTALYNKLESLHVRGTLRNHFVQVFDLVLHFINSHLREV